MSAFFGESNRISCKIARIKLFAAWKTFDFSRLCVIGFTFGNDIFMKVCAHDYLSDTIGITRESGTPDFFRIRFTPAKKWKEAHLHECARLCTVDELRAYMESTNAENMGTAFECFLKNYLHCADTTKDNTPFTESADMTLNGITYTIKYENATLCGESYFLNRGFTTADFETL